MVPLLDAGHGAQAFLRALATAEAAGLEVDWGPENKRPTRRPRRVFTNFTRESATRASSAGRQAKVAGATRTEGGEAMGMRWLDRTVILHEISKTSGFSEDRIAMQDRLHSDLGLDSLMISALARSLAERGPFSREQLMDKLSGDPTIKTALLALGAGPNGKVDEGGSVAMRSGDPRVIATVLMNIAQSFSFSYGVLHDSFGSVDTWREELNALVKGYLRA